MLRNALWIVALCGLLVGCSGSDKEQSGENKTDGVSQADSSAVANVSPKGSWIMYAGSQTGMRMAEDFQKEMTILILEDSTYTLTMMQPHIQLNFVEKGRVDYDMRNNKMKFSVFSATGVDFSGAEPRKLVDVDQVVPWQRDPGTVYLMSYIIDHEKDLMQLSMEDTEDSYFLRMKPGDEGATFDVKMAPGEGQ